MKKSAYSQRDRAARFSQAWRPLPSRILAIMAVILLAALVDPYRLEAATSTVSESDRISQQPSFPGIHELMFVDPSIGDLQALLRGLRPSVETLVLDPERDGVLQITEVLRHRRGLRAIHIVSHGGPGTLALGVGTLNASPLDAPAGRFAAALGTALAEDGDVLIYGCNFGAGRRGRLAVQALARATGADIAASDDLTGNTAFGGDWHLEVTEGHTATLPVVAFEGEFGGVLQGDNSEYTPINIRVDGIFSKTLTFLWDIAHPRGQASGQHHFRLEYRVLGSGEVFQHGGSTHDPFTSHMENAGYIDGLEPDTAYEVRIRWQSDLEGLSRSPWGVVNARTKPLLDVDLKAARAVAGQDGEDPFGEGGVMTATWEYLPGSETRSGTGRQYLSLRVKGSQEFVWPWEFVSSMYYDESDQAFGMAAGLAGGSEYEVRVVEAYPLSSAYDGSWSPGRTYEGFDYPLDDVYRGAGRFAFNASDWVAVGPNTPPEFIEADWWYQFQQGRSGRRRRVVAISEGGALTCKHEDGRPQPIPCPPATAVDPDGDTLTYLIDPGQDADKFEFDPDTGELRARARGVVALEESFLSTTGVFSIILRVVDDRGGFDRMELNFSISRLPRLEIVPELGEPPVANAGLEQTVTTGETVTLDGSRSSDPEGKPLSYVWYQTYGPAVTLFKASAVGPSFVAPAGLEEDAELIFSLTVSDGLNNSLPDPVTVRVRRDIRPVVVCPANGDVDQNGNVTAADALLVFQQALSLTVLSDCQLSIADVFPQPAAPDGDITAADALCVFRKALGLPSCLGSDSLSNQPPVVNAGGDQSVDGGIMVILSGTAIDPDGTIVRYAWEQTGGPRVPLSGYTNRTAMFASPAVKEEELTFRLTATDNTGVATSDEVTVTVIEGFERFTSVSAGPSHTCGIRDTGEVECWGEDTDGQSRPPTGTFTSLSTASVASSHMGNYTCGIRDTGTVECWGSDRQGAAMPPPGAFTSVSAGYEHACGIRDTGTVECWGNNDQGQLSLTPTGTFTSVGAGEYHTCALRTTGSIECWGRDVPSAGILMAPAGTFTSVSAGYAHTCGIRDTGEAECWGSNSGSRGYSGQSRPPAGTFTSVSAGAYHTCGVRGTGTVECWGRDREGAETPPPGTFISVSAGAVHTCGIRDTGAVECWGGDRYGQSRPPTGMFTSVSAGGIGHYNYYTCGVRDTGTVACWGTDQRLNSYKGQSRPPTGTFTSVSAGSYHVCGIRETGTVECWGDNVEGESTPPPDTFTSVSVGFVHTCGIRDTGKVECWGSNFSGNLYKGQSRPPTGTFASVSAGPYHTCGIRDTGTVECWGGNTEGESTPPPGMFTSISAGVAHTCGIRGTGEVECWGSDSSGQLTPPLGRASSGMLRFTSVSAGPYHTCGVRDTGEVVCWGGNRRGWFTPPEGLFASVSAEEEYTCGIRRTGTVACWGRRAYGVKDSDF